MIQTPRDPQVIEASRKRAGVSKKWPWAECENDCGDIVFYPPSVDTRPMHGTPMVKVCSLKCARELIARQQADLG